MMAMINLKWGQEGTASSGEIMGRGKTSETGRDSEVVEKNGESSKKVTSVEIKYR